METGEKGGVVRSEKCKENAHYTLYLRVLYTQIWKDEMDGY